MLQAGISGFWTPRLVPREGPCDYTCHLCGQICPTGAIPELPLDVKQKTVSGKAKVNNSRCLEWAEGADCLICREFCPLPVKAIEKRERIEKDEQGKIRIIHGPVVITERCIGCGICEYLCPVEGDAVIRVQRIEL
jgi:formate hydrogenlyase subunit 6/NADH:ubiquinone oxidoreductase subunit I